MVEGANVFEQGIVFISCIVFIFVHAILQVVLKLHGCGGSRVCVLNLVVILNKHAAVFQIETIWTV